MSEKRGQVSVEYLIVVGFIVFLVIGLVGVALLYTSTIREQIRASQVENYAQKIIEASESVFYSGQPSKATITAYLPAGVTNVEISNEAGVGYAIIIDLQTDAGVSKRAFPSNVPIILKIGTSLSPDEGVKKITITAQATYAEVDEE